MESAFKFVLPLFHSWCKVVEKQVSEADELSKYKALLDKGAITQEEFDAKKKQLLGL